MHRQNKKVILSIVSSLNTNAYQAHIRMKECIGDYFLKDGEILSCKLFSDDLITCRIPVYDVIRVIDSVFLFIEDHLDRLQQSITLAGFDYKIDREVISRQLNILSDHNKLTEGNARLVFCFNNKRSGSLPQIYLYYIRHHYPEPMFYEKGSRLISYTIERENPNAKVLNKKIIKLRNELTGHNDVFEILLINKRGMVTEASRANIFFTKGLSLYTPPSHQVLEGITRKYIYQLAGESEIPLIEKEIPYREIRCFEGCFITGTSPRVLPVRQIDDVDFNPHTRITDKMIKAYDKLIQTYIHLKE